MALPQQQAYARWPAEIRVDPFRDEVPTYALENLQPLRVPISICTVELAVDCLLQGRGGLVEAFDEAALVGIGECLSDPKRPRGVIIDEAVEGRELERARPR